MSNTAMWRPRGRVEAAMRVALGVAVGVVATVVPLLAAEAVASVAPRQGVEPLSIDVGEKRARLTLRAGLDGVNGGMNFNGAARGAHSLVLPVGWRLQVTLINDDNALPHSVMIVPATDSVPNRVSAPAFQGAATDGATDGTVVGDTSAFAFTASRTGAYWIFCAVPGHGKAGMYLRLTVSRTALVPRYQ